MILSLEKRDSIEHAADQIDSKMCYPIALLTKDISLIFLYDCNKYILQIEVTTYRIFYRSDGVVFNRFSFNEGAKFVVVFVVLGCRFIRIPFYSFC